MSIPLSSHCGGPARSSEGGSRSDVEWERVGAVLAQRLEDAPLVLIPQGRAPTLEWLEERFPEARRIFVVDFYVEVAERGVLLENEAGYQLSERVYAIDHHAPGQAWEHFISSGNLACRWVRTEGAVSSIDGDIVVINHTDCDSVVASLVMTGLLPPHPRLEEAVIDADHRGAPNEIADVLQSGSESRDLPWLVGALAAVLRGAPIDERMRACLEQLESKRRYVRELVERGDVVNEHGIIFARCDRQMDSDLFLSVFQEARAVVIACPSERCPSLEITRIRLGRALQEGASLHRLGVTELDPHFGGRFNAGSNKRGLEELLNTGRPVEPVAAWEYFRLLVSKLGQDPQRFT